MNGFTIFKLVVVAVAVIVFAGVTLNLMTTSYAEYQEYYKAVMAEKEYNKYLESLPYTYEGVSVTLNSDVIYYANGTANPKKDDFLVIAHFSEKGKELDKILSSDEFEIDIPTSFSTNGGTVTVSYAYQPEKAEDAETAPAAIIRSADIDISLTPVVLTALNVLDNPYRVYYSDNMEFDAEGIKLEAVYNCGDKVILGASDVNVVDAGTLTAGAESAKVAYTSDGVTIEAQIPIKVSAAADYNEGEIVKIKAEGDVFVIDGKSVEDASPVVRATYESGNRLLISSDAYTVSANVATAAIDKNCVLKVSLKNNASVSCQTSATVLYAGEAESAVANGGLVKTIDEYVYENGEYKKVGSASVKEIFSDGTTLTFTVNSQYLAKAGFIIRVANTSGEAVKLSDMLTVKVNGRSIPVPVSALLETCVYTGGGIFHDVVMPDVVLNAGSNTVELIFSNMVASVAVDKINLSTKYEGVVSSNIEDYFYNCITDGVTIAPDLEMVKSFHTVTNGTYVHGMCTDGEYIYVTRTINETPRHIMVTKYNATTFNIIKSVRTSEAVSAEYNAGITYYDGKIIIFCSDGRELCIDSSLSGEFTEYDGFAFEGTEGIGLRDVYYNSLTEQFAVFTVDTVTIYGKDMKAVTSFDIQKQSGYNSSRMSASNDYIYVGFNVDGAYQPLLQMYDWSGKFIGRINIPNGTSVVGNITLSKSNIQGFVVLNNELYFTHLCWSPNGAAFIKVSAPAIEEKVSSTLNIGEYIAASGDAGLSASATAKPAFGTQGKIDVAGNYAMDIVSDGKYLYVSMTGLNNLTAVISKVDPVTHEVLGETVTFVPADVSGDNSKLFIKGDTLYCIIRDGSMYSIKLDSFNGTNCDVVKSNLSFADYGTAFDAVWSDAAGRFALITTNGRLHILNENLTVVKRDIVLENGSLTPLTVTSDDKYVYVNYKNGNNKDINSVDVYTWDGEKVGSFTISGFTMGKDVNFNVQAISIIDGQLHATVCSWTNGYMKYFDWVVEFDQSTVNP